MDFSSIKKVIIELTKRNYRSLLAMSFIIFVMTTFALTSDLLLSGSFILLFFIIVLPFFISMIIVNIKFKANVEFTPKQISRQNTVSNNNEYKIKKEKRIKFNIPFVEVIHVQNWKQLCYGNNNEDCGENKTRNQKQHNFSQKRQI